MKAVLMVAALPGNRQVVSRFLAEKGLPRLTAGSVADVESQLDTAPDIACAVVDASGFTTDLRRVCLRLIEQKIPLFWIVPASPRHGGPPPPPGVSGVWQKPLSQQQFLAAVRECLETT